MKTIPSITVLAWLLSSAPAVVFGDDISWDRVVSGQFDDAALWSPPRVPAAGDRAVYSVQAEDRAAYTVAFSRDVTTQRLDITDPVTFQLDGHTYTLQFGLDPFQTSLLLAGGPLKLIGGVMDIVSPPEQTSVVMEAGSELFLTESAKVKTSGDWEFTTAGSAAGSPRIVVNEGSVSVGGNARITYPEVDAVVEVVGPHSAWQSNETLVVGQSGRGAFRVRDGGSVSVQRWTLLGAASGEGAVTVCGPGSSWSNSDQLIIAGEGRASLAVRDGGTVFSSGLISGVVGSAFESTGDVRVADPGSSWMNEGSLWVGLEGQGTLLIDDGGTVTSAGEISGVLGAAAAGVGDVQVGGSGARWINRGQVIVGDGGRGTLKVDDGGEVLVDRATSLGHQWGSYGEITVTGPGSRWTQPFDQLIVGFGGEGRLTVAGGATVDTATTATTSGVIGGNGTGTGVATITGAGSEWNNVDGGLVVGYFGQGALEIAAGGAVHSHGGVVGKGPGAIGSVTVSGNGSRWNSTDPLTVGSEENDVMGGTGTVVLTDGGLITAPTIRIGPGGHLAGEGVTTGQVVNGGIVTAGDPLGTLRVEGDYIQDDQGVLKLHVSGAEPGKFGAIRVSGQAKVGGSLEVSLGEQPAFTSGDTLPVLTAASVAGRFSGVSVPTTDQGEPLFSVTVGPDTVALSALRDVGPSTVLRAGDADMDLDFDSSDLVQVLIAGKYLSDQPATWGEGDWDGAPGGGPGDPPPGDTRFDQWDVVAALRAGIYQTGPYAVTRPVPEPRSIVVLGVGLLVLIGWARRAIHV